MSAAAAHVRAGLRYRVLRISIQRGVRLRYPDIATIEAELERMRPAYECRGETRYTIVVKRQAGRLLTIYDTRLGCLADVWPIGRAVRRAKAMQKKTVD